jgi:DNA gyrase/topoisomerase IV subunit A
VNAYKAGMAKFNPRDRTHTETLVNGKQHAIITELK